MNNKVERAIIMAAGLGKRMKPVSDDIPKPLIQVNGARMIDTVIDALISNGIEDIVVVVGYKKEQFKVLLDKYSNIELVENQYYDTCNNISSLYSVRAKLDRPCIILDGDQIIYNPKILSKDFNYSGYSASYTESETDEWLMQNENGFVTSCSRTGGNKGWQLFSISRWTKDDAICLSRFVTEEFNKGNRQIYWDDIPMFVHFKDFKLSITEISKEDIIEIDSYDELCELDDTYKNYSLK